MSHTIVLLRGLALATSLIAANLGGTARATTVVSEAILFGQPCINLSIEVPLRPGDSVERCFVTLPMTLAGVADTLYGSLLFCVYPAREYQEASELRSQAADIYWQRGDGTYTIDVTSTVQRTSSGLAIRAILSDFRSEASDLEIRLPTEKAVDSARVGIVYGTTLAAPPRCASENQSRNRRMDPESAEPFVSISPNPFNPKITIELSGWAADCPGAAVRIYDVRGRQTAGWAPAGQRIIEWTARSPGGGPLPSGLYFCQYGCVGDARRVTRKLMLVK